MIIPSGFFNSYYQAADEFIDNSFIGKDVTVVYETKEDCPNCNQNNYDGSISPFNNGLCPYCGGKSFIETQNTENIRLRVYHNNKSWIKIGNIETADGRAQIIGYASDAQKISQSSYLILFNSPANLRYKLSSDIFPHGFGNKYFIAFIDKCLN